MAVLKGTSGLACRHCFGLLPVLCSLVFCLMFWGRMSGSVIRPALWELGTVCLLPALSSRRESCRIEEMD